MPSNSATVNAVHRDLDLYFQSQDFGNVNISKNGESKQKMLKYDCYGRWYLPSNGTIVNVVLFDLDLNC